MLEQGKSGWGGVTPRSCKGRGCGERKRTLRRSFLLIGLLSCGFSGCSATSPNDSGIDSTAVVQQPIVAASAQIQARPIRGFRDLVEQTAALVEGVITRVENEYSEDTGPWTVYVLNEVVSHLGTVGRGVCIRQAGGTYPDGRRSFPSSFTPMAVGGRYVVFLRNTKWHLSPVLGGLAFRVEQLLDGTEVLVDSEGGILEDVTANGVTLSDQAFPRTDLQGGIDGMVNVRAVPRLPMSRKRLVAQVLQTMAKDGLRVRGMFKDTPEQPSADSVLHRGPKSRTLDDLLPSEVDNGV